MKPLPLLFVVLAVPPLSDASAATCEALAAATELPAAAGAAQE